MLLGNCAYGYFFIGMSVRTSICHFAYFLILTAFLAPFESVATTT